MNTRRFNLSIGFLVIVFMTMLSAPVWATDYDECDHPRFQERGCTYPGEQGPPGNDGADGKDGKDGRDGIDGKDGRDGIDGRDGEVPTEWIIETRNWYEQLREVAAAQQAMQVYLPQDQQSRLTMGMSRVAGTTGLGIGYAYMIDNESNTAMTLAVGRAGSETAVSASVGFEFGGRRKMALPAVEIRYVPEEADESFNEPQLAMAAAPYDYNNDTLLADLTAEQIAELKDELQAEQAEQAELVEYRQSQQKNLIDAQALELEKLRLQAEALRKAEESRAANRAAVRALLEEKK